MSEIDKMLRKIQKVPIGQAFHFADIGIRHSGANTNQMVQRGVIEKIGVGEYKRVKDGDLPKFWASQNHKGIKTKEHNPYRRAQPRSPNKLRAIAKPMKEAFRMVPWQGGQVLFIVGRKTFIGTEVAVVPRGGNF